MYRTTKNFKQDSCSSYPWNAENYILFMAQNLVLFFISKRNKHKTKYDIKKSNMISINFN